MERPQFWGTAEPFQPKQYHPTPKQEANQENKRNNWTRSGQLN